MPNPKDHLQSIIAKYGFMLHCIRGKCTIYTVVYWLEYGAVVSTGKEKIWWSTFHFPGFCHVSNGLKFPFGRLIYLSNYTYKNFIIIILLRKTRKQKNQNKTTNYIAFTVSLKQRLQLVGTHSTNYSEL